MNGHKAVSVWLLTATLLVLVSARHVPSTEDLLADMLVLVNTSKIERHIDTRSIEGSGFGDIPIQPLSLPTMERMEQAPTLESHNIELIEESHKDDINTYKPFLDEGSGVGGLEAREMLEDFNVKIDEEKLSESQKNYSLHDETKDKEITNEDSTDESFITGIRAETHNSGLENDENSEVEFITEDNSKSAKIISMVKESGEENRKEEEHADTLKVEEGDEKDNTELETTGADLEPTEIVAIGREELESVNTVEVTGIPLSVDTDLISTIETPQEENLDHTATSSEFVQKPLDISTTAKTEILETTTVSDIVSTEASTEIAMQVDLSPESIPEIYSSTEKDIIYQSTSEVTIIETPTEITSEDTNVSEPEIEISTDSPLTISTDSPLTISTTLAPILPSSTTSFATDYLAVSSANDNDSEKEIKVTNTSVDLATDDVINITNSLEPNLENETILLKASLQIPLDENNGITDNTGTVQESSIYKSLSLYVIAGILAIALIVLVIAAAMRYRSRRRMMRTDNRSEKDTENGLLGNGKYQEDSDENNIKNNEITPLVIKNSSQINKFEKSPNFSSQKNINTAVNDKNIEKDNVLKSNQTIIEDEDDTKKCIENDVDDEKKKTLEETTPLAAEKVVVHTRVDLDSIPRKPIIVNRNGHSYHAVPGGDTET